MAKLTSLQQKFVNELFGASLGSIKEASKKVLGTEDYSSIMTEDMLSEVRKRADAELVMQAPKAVHTITKMLENPEGSFFMDKLHKICSDVLDRAGITKKETSHGGGQLAIGVVFLPSKNTLPEPPTLEQERKFEGPILLSSPVIINDLQT